MRNLTYWLWQFGGAGTARALGWDGQTVASLAETIKEATPRYWRPAICVKAHSGGRWQAAFDHHPLAVGGVMQLDVLRHTFQAHGVAFAVWGEPRGDPEASGQRAGEAAAVAGYYCADVEPYSDFEIDPSPDYAERFWAAYRAASGGPECGVSLVPQRSGLAPFGPEGIRAWLRPARYVQPQCYANSASQLHPDVALPVLNVALRDSRVRPRVVPIFDLGMELPLATLLRLRRWRWGADAWRL